MEIKTRINKWDLIKCKSICITKETINATKRQLGENICKWSDWQGINLQNIQIAHIPQYIKKQQQQKKQE